ncbi:MAG: hypothetical protein JRJ84_23895, partial [Deltaproteobacteria bacterium]|nr:hypothetical protein [Deltaproteobacteria bacterium]
MVALFLVMSGLAAAECEHTQVTTTTEVVGLSADGRKWAVRRVVYAMNEACVGFCGYPKLSNPAALSLRSEPLAKRAPAAVTLHLCEAYTGPCGAEGGWPIYELALEEVASEWDMTWIDPDKSRCTPHEAAVVQLEAAKAAYLAAGVELG